MSHSHGVTPSQFIGRKETVVSVTETSVHVEEIIMTL